MKPRVMESQAEEEDKNQSQCIASSHALRVFLSVYDSNNLVFTGS